MDVLEPVLASASLIVLGALVLLAYMIVMYPKRDI